jgi:hypothetical protein
VNGDCPAGGLLPVPQPVRHPFQELLHAHPVLQHADPLKDMAVGAVEFFVESRLNLGAEDALAAAATFRPDLVVADVVD